MSHPLCLSCLLPISINGRGLKCTLQDYVKAVRSFKLKDAFPNMESHPYDWRVDKYEPQRVWFTIRNTATHTGPLHFAGATYKATGKVRRRFKTSGWQSCALGWPCNLLCGRSDDNSTAAACMR